jgi:hypothetical protein
MQIYVHRNNQQIGPFTEAEIRAQLASGAISPADHAWWQGQSGWVPLSQTPFGGASAPAAPVVPGAPPVPAAPYPAGVTAPTSKLAIWALVCGCLSLLCGLFASIPAIILGHMGVSEIKKNPAVQGRGMALAGMILGYVFTVLIVIYLVSLVVLISMGNNVQDVFKTIDAQIKAAQAATNSADQNATPPDQSTKSTTTPDSSTTNSADQSTNNVPATTNAPDSSTNSDSSTNAPSSTTNAPATNQ